MGMGVCTRTRLRRCFAAFASTGQIASKVFSWTPSWHRVGVSKCGGGGGAKCHALVGETFRPCSILLSPPFFLEFPLSRSRSSRHRQQRIHAWSRKHHERAPPPPRARARFDRLPRVWLRGRASWRALRDAAGTGRLLARRTARSCHLLWACLEQARGWVREGRRRTGRRPRRQRGEPSAFPIFSS